MKNQFSEFCEYEPERLVREMTKNAPINGEVRAALDVVLIRQLSSSIKEYKESSDKLSGRVLGLNIILGIFTVVGAIFGIIQFFC